LGMRGTSRLSRGFSGHETIDTLLALGGPNRPDIRANTNDIGDYINVFSHNDNVQANVAGPLLFLCPMCSSDTSDQADQNIEVSDVNGNPVGHSGLHTPEVLDQVKTKSPMTPQQNANYWENVRETIQNKTSWN
jgi:hypothetical protein